MKWSDRYSAEGLAPASHRWAAQYVQIAETLGSVLGPAWAIEHVGSTSVPGLASKPVIDLAIRTPTSATADRSAALFTAAGWTAPRELGDHMASFLLVGDQRTAIAHIFTAEQWPEAHVRLFSEWLRSHPQDRDRHEALKLDLLRAGAWEDGSYTMAKGDFVLEIVNRAREAEGLPPHDGPL